MHESDFPTTPIYFFVPIPPLSPRYFSSHNTVAKATEIKSFYERACYFLSFVCLFLRQGSSRIVAGGNNSWCTLRIVWCNHIPGLFSSDRHGSEIARLMSKPRQHWCHERKHPAGALRPGRCQSACSALWGGTGTGLILAAAAPSLCLALHQPMREFLHPWTRQ